MFRYFFPIDRRRRRNKPFRRRARFYHRIAARIVARRLMRESETFFVSRDGNSSEMECHVRVRVNADAIAAHVLSVVAEYDVAPYEIREADKG